jgi:putative photosynthetic complex assembly protein 2
MVTAGLFAVLLWWGATQALISLVRVAPPVVLNAIALVLGGVSAIGAVWATHSAGPMAAYAGFASGIGLWGAFEILFLSGAVLGIKTRPQSPRLGHRAWAAFRSILWHEGALVATIAALAVATMGTENPVALYTFALLWAMRASAKLNLFLGVRNLCAELLPPRIAHLATHFRQADINPLFPFSVLAGTLGAAFLLRAGLDPLVEDGAAISTLLLAALVALGTLEHWLMLTPLSPLAFWRTPREPAPAQGADDTASAAR